MFCVCARTDSIAKAGHCSFHSLQKLELSWSGQTWADDAPALICLWPCGVSFIWKHYDQKKSWRWLPGQGAVIESPYHDCSVRCKMASCWHQHDATALQNNKQESRSLSIYFLFHFKKTLLSCFIVLHCLSIFSLLLYYRIIVIIVIIIINIIINIIIVMCSWLDTWHKSICPI